MNEITAGYFSPFNKKIQIHEYKKWQSMWDDFKSLCVYGGPDGTINFWVVYEGYIYYGNSPEQLSKLRKILDYRKSCCDVLTMNVKKWNNENEF